jgi:hypothetical protein
MLARAQPFSAGRRIQGAVVGEAEAKDLNRAREYLRDAAGRHGVEVRGAPTALQRTDSDYYCGAARGGGERRSDCTAAH